MSGKAKIPENRRRGGAVVESVGDHRFVERGMRLEAIIAAVRRPARRAARSVESPQ
jgi:hypothetical protein